MANKLPKQLFGATGLEAANGTLGKKGTANNIPVRFKSGGSVYEGIISKQKGARRFRCSTDNGTTAVEICKLVEGTNLDPVNNGEMTIVGYLNGTGRTLRKLNLKTSADFNGNRFKWDLSDDSTETLIILTAI